MDILIKQGRVIDPVNKCDGVFDVLVEKGTISKVAKTIDGKARLVIDAKGKIVAPGLIDMHVHLREPGREDMETVASGTRAAIAGGITGISAMPNTRPALDNPGILKNLKAIIKKDAIVNVFIVGAITKDRKGALLVDMKAMKKEGAIALSDDGSSIQDEPLMRKALKAAKDAGLLLISHCEDKKLSESGVVNEGIIATKLGLRGIPRRAEYEFVDRDVKLAQKENAALHIAHVSCKEAVDIIRKAKKAGAPVTAETAPHYFSLDETACTAYDTRTKMNPPLRSPDDVQAIKEGLADGTIDAIASDHAPHGKHEKEIEFDAASFGIIGLETSLALAITNLADKKNVPWVRIIELMSAAPARILGLKKKGTLSPGSDADIVIIDPEKEWVYTKEAILSKSKNSPFINWRFKGKVTRVIVEGREILPRIFGHPL